MKILFSLLKKFKPVQWLYNLFHYKSLLHNKALGKEVVLFQTLNFIKGSNQRAHSDSIHMTTYPLGYLIAVWIALEDTNDNNGPLFYYPGSHKLTYLLNNDFNETSNLLKLGKKDYTDYEKTW
ncbi:MAG: phytanoyl-CoA dioxygenase [Segetibacter sp.]|nr:phytanoyl-CoA dioxygenase [Segetibacter sp.]